MEDALPVGGVRVAHDVRLAVLHGRMSFAQRVAVALCCSMLAIDGYDLVAVTFAMPGIAAEWGTGKAMLGALFSIGMVGMAGGCLVLGPLSDLVGRRPMAIASLLLMTIGMIFSALAPNILTLMAWRMCVGLGIGVVVSVAYPLSVEYSTLAARPVTLAFMVIAFPLGGAVGGWFAASLMGSLGWRAAFVPGIVIPPFAILLSLKWLPEPLGLLIEKPRPSSLQRANLYLKAIGCPPVDSLPPPSHPDKAPVRRVLGPEFLRATFFLSSIYCLYSLTAYFVLAWLPQIVTEIGFPPAIASTVSVATSTGGMVGAAITGFAIRRLGVFAVLGSLLLGLAAAVFVIGVAPADILLLRALGLVTGIFIFGPIVGLTLLVAEEYPVEVRATGMGLIVGLSRWFAGVGPLIGGVLISSRLGIAGSCLLMGVASALAAAMLAQFHAGRRRYGAAPPEAARL